MCAIESAAHHNPNRTIFVLFASPTDSKVSSVVLKSYANVHFLNVNLNKFVEKTPAKKFYQSGELFASNYLVEHMSDFLRLLVLYKCGGIYLDMDVVVQKNMDDLPANILGEEAYEGNNVGSVNEVVLGFQDKIGHKMIKLCLKQDFKLKRL